MLTAWTRGSSKRSRQVALTRSNPYRRPAASARSGTGSAAATSRGRPRPEPRKVVPDTQERPRVDLAHPAKPDHADPQLAGACGHGTLPSPRRSAPAAPGAAASPMFAWQQEEGGTVACREPSRSGRCTWPASRICASPSRSWWRKATRSRCAAPMRAPTGGSCWASHLQGARHELGALQHTPQFALQRFELGDRAGEARARHRPVRRWRAERAVHGQHELSGLERAVLVRVLEQREHGRRERHVGDVFDPVRVGAVGSARDRGHWRVRRGRDGDVAVLDVTRGHRG
jgi:hypothetical protein